MADKKAGIASREKMVSKESWACIKKAPLNAPRIPPKRPIPNIQATPVARPCFAGDARRLILPAFGSLTGGLAAEDPAIRENFAGPYRAMLVARGRLLAVPCGNDVPRDDATASRIVAGR